MNRVVYFSRGGNTKKLAGAVARGAGVTAVSVEQFDPSETTDTLYVGASIYAGAVDGGLRRFLAALQPSQVKTVIVFGTSAGKKTALPEVKAILEPHGISVAADEFHCRGSFLFANRGRPDEEDLKQAEAFARRTCGGRE